MKKKYPAVIALSCCPIFLIPMLLIPISSGAREYSLSGGVGMYQSYDSNSTRAKNNSQPQWTSTIAPSLTLRSASQSDQVTLNYEPGYTYNDRTEEGNVDHKFSLDSSKHFAQYFTGTLSDSFVPGETGTDRAGNIFVETSRPSSANVAPETSGAATPGAPAEPTTPATYGMVLSQDRSASRYWMNNFSIGTSYQYWRNSFLDLSYVNSIFDNEEPALVDYVRHMPGAKVRHRFSQEWSTDVSLNFSKGEFSKGEDLTTTSPGARINYNYSPHTSFFVDYRHSKAEYSGTRPGYETYTPSFGCSGSLDQFTSLSAQLGASLTKRDNGANNNGLSYSLSLSRRLEHGGLSISGSGGHEAQNYNGLLTNNNTTEGLSQYWSFNGNLTHQLWKDLYTSIQAGVRGDDQIEQSSSSKKTAYNAGASLSYSFLRYYGLSLRYNYRQVDADLSDGDYTAQQVYLSLSAASELFRW